ncbi:MAG: hypothetical protein QXV32_02575 [Conexivisphaerales archaeon]
MVRILARNSLLIILAVIIALILATIAPLATPSSLSIASFQPSPNPMLPMTNNPDFEQGLASWSVSHGSNSTVEVVSGEGYSSSHSLYINAPANDVMTDLFYIGNQTLPLDINSSTFFSFAMKYVGPSQLSGSVPSLQVIIVVSYLDKWTIPVFVLVGNYSLPQQYTLVNQTTLGIALTKSATVNSTWQQYILQLGSDRMLSLYQQFLKTYGITVANSRPSDYFVTGFFVHPSNIICYLDDIGLYNSYPAVAKLVVAKSTLLPSDSILASISLNQMPVYYTFSYGALRDTYFVPVNIPVAAGMTFDIRLQTVTGFVLSENFTVKNGPLVI